MLPIERLDLDGDDDQLDLFYLVDQVLDEIEVAKRAAENKKRADDIVDDDSNMPEHAVQEYDTYDIMDHIEIPDSYSEDSFNSSVSSSIDTNPTVMQQLPQHAGNPAHHEQTFCIPPEEFIGIESHEEVVDIEQLYLQDCVSNAQYTCSNIKKDNIVPQTEYHYVHPDLYHQNIPDVRGPHQVSNQNSIDAHIDLSFPEIPELNTRYPEVSKYVQSQVVYSDEESNDAYNTDFKGWTRKHPESWSTSDVLDWLFYCAGQIAHEIGEDCSDLRAEEFRNVNGEILCKMGPEDFRVREPKFGLSFYELFRKLINDRVNFIQPSDIPVLDQNESDTSFCESEFSTSSRYSSLQTPVSGMQTPDYNPGHHYSNSLKSGQSSTRTSPEMYPAYLQFDYGTPNAQVQSQTSVEALIAQNHPSLLRSYDSYNTSYNYQYYSQDLQTDVAAIRAKYESGITPMRRRPGRPRTKTVQTEEELAAQRAKKLKSQHLWEFIYDLLNNPSYNPTVLKWENQSEGVFRFIQSETVAQLWGTLKSNEHMTYEKLSRAMRHYYKRGIMERVEGRRLVYKFSRITLEKMREKHGYQ